MSQPSVAAYFNARKRPATDDVQLGKSKVFITSSEPSSLSDGREDPVSANTTEVCRRVFKESLDSQFGSPGKQSTKNNRAEDFQLKKEASGGIKDGGYFLKTNTTAAPVAHTRTGRSLKRIGTTVDDNDRKQAKLVDEQPKSLKQKTLVEFKKIGSLSPLKKYSPVKDQSNLQALFASKESFNNIERGIKTPIKSKSVIGGDDLHRKDNTASLVKKELNFEEVKTKVTRSAKLQELKASLQRIKDLEKTRKIQSEKNRRLRNGESVENIKLSTVALKEFKTIELEVLSSPQKKDYKTPTKVPPAPGKNELMSPKNTTTARKVLLSPSKEEPSASPSKVIPAYQRFQVLAESGRPTLQLPYKYRILLEMFKCLDSVCAMFYNRKEIITYKKLKPAVQRMLRKNFDELHLAQIKHLYPEAFSYTQMKMRNYGSISKQDYFQLVISPNVDGTRGAMTQICEDDILKSAQVKAMNPQVMIDRQQKFQKILLNMVKDHHDKFLKSLDPPLVIAKDKLVRWHPEFNLEKLPDIQPGHLPQPPNVEKYSSAKDILSTARNLFSCATPMERAMERLEAHIAANTISTQFLNQPTEETNTESSSATSKECNAASILKNVPKSLLEKIRAKQAAKTLDAMTRRPSQELVATRFSRLPELARHLRNVFVTEKKGVLPLDIVMDKIQNSFRTSMTQKEIEDHLRLLVKECSKWMQIHEIRKTQFVKFARDIDMSKILQHLEKVAISNSK